MRTYRSRNGITYLIFKLVCSYFKLNKNVDISFLRRLYLYAQIRTFFLNFKKQVFTVYINIFFKLFYIWYAYVMGRYNNSYLMQDKYFYFSTFFNIQNWKHWVRSLIIHTQDTERGVRMYMPLFLLAFMLSSITI